MPTKLEYAALSAFVYNDQRGGGGAIGDLNRLDLPPGWIQLRPSNGFTGDNLNTNPFSITAGAYLNQSTGEIVVAYKGTDFLTKFEGRSWNTAADLLADAALGTALRQFNVPVQLYASSYYASVKSWAADNGYDSSKISFTGHSLGGGLASNMAVWFNKPATTFAEGPFELSTGNRSAMVSTISTLTAQAAVSGSAAVLDAINPLRELLLSLPAVLNGDKGSVFNVRESAVTNYYNQGEFLDYLRSGPTTVYGTTNAIDIGPQPINRALALHSMNLHAAFLYDDRLRALARTMPELVPALIDTRLYAVDPNDRTKDLVTTLVNDQLRQGFDGDSALKRFTSELMKLQGDGGMAAQLAVRTALIAAGMDYFYNTEPSATTRTIFSNDNNGIHLNLSDLGIEKSKSKALPLLVQSMRPFISIDDLSEGKLYAQDAWHIQSGTSGMNWSGGSAIVRDVGVGGAQTDVLDGGGGADILIGGAGADFLTGGAGTDILIGGVGDDVLKSGTGNDTLQGGGGADIYEFSSGDGKDIITDSDGLGSIVLNGKTLGKADAMGARSQWKDANGVIYRFDQNESDTKGWLTIKSGETGDEITINNFDLKKAEEEGYLGIKIDLTQKLGITVGGSDTGPSGNRNLWNDFDFNIQSLAGKASQWFEGAARTVHISLAQGAQQGARVVLEVAGGISDKLKAILGDETVAANGATITLAEGQTSVAFALVGADGIEADLTGSIKVRYEIDSGSGNADGGSGPESSAESNSWGLTLKDAGEPEQTLQGDYTVAWVEHHGAALTRTGTDGSTIEIVKDGDARYTAGADGNLVRDDANGILITNNVLYGTAGKDKIQAGLGNDLVAGGAGNDQLEGADGDDMIAGGTGSDTITGGDGSDHISSTAGLQPNLQQRGALDQWTRWGLPAGKTARTSGATWGVYETGQGQEAETIWSAITATDTQDTGGDVIDAGAGDDYVIASWGADRIQGGDGDDELDALAGDDIVEGGAGDDHIDADGIVKPGYLNTVAAQNHGNDFADGGEGDDEVTGGGGSDDLFGGAGNDKLWGDTSGKSNGAYFVGLQYHGNDYLDGEDGDDQIEGNGGDDTLFGGAGKDFLVGDTDADNLVGAAASDASAWGNDYLDGEDDDDELAGGGKDDELFGGDGDDKLWGDQSSTALAGQFHGADYLDGEGGKDQLIGGGKDDRLYGGAGDDLMLGDDTQDKVAGEHHGSDTLDGEDGNDQLLGGGKDDTLYGGAGNDFLHGDDFLSSLAAEHHGNDYLDGEDGDDVLAGGGKDDELFGGAGDDQLSGDSFELAAEAHGADHLDGEDGNDQLIGGGKDDTLFGGAGDDNLWGDDSPATLAGTQHGNDYLDGGDGNDQLVGGGGADQLMGGAGNDVLSGDGPQSSLAPEFHGNDTLDGGDGDDTLFGGAGNDDLKGGAGNDILVSDGTVNDLAYEFHGSDTLDGGMGDDRLFAGAGDDVLLGGDGNDTLNSGDGADTLDGGAGNDIYGVLNTQGDKVIAEGYANPGGGGGGGDDTLDLRWPLHYTYAERGSLILVNRLTGQKVHIEGFDLNDPASECPIEKFVMLSESGSPILLTAEQLIAHLLINIEGTEADDTLVGTPRADRLIGNGGADVLEGLQGNDRYELGDGAGDTVVEEAGGGIDTVVVSASYTLDGTELENLTLTGAQDLQGTGNGYANVLVGNDGANLLDGRAGADRMTGGLGDDTYIVDDVHDTVTEQADAGTDTVFSSVNWTLGDHVEHLFLTAGALEGEGNGLGNRIEGNEADNVLSGHDGDDVLIGHDGDDILDGGAGDDELSGGTGNDSLRGGEGADTLVGGVGDDLYRLDEGSDTVVELAGEGHDTVEAARSYSIEGTELEGINLIGDQVLTATGNDYANLISANQAGSTLLGLGGDDGLLGGGGDDTLSGGTGADWLGGGGGADALDGGEDADWLYGHDGADTLDGGAGADHMFGGAGDDTYHVDDEGEVVVEEATPTYLPYSGDLAALELNGHDTVISSVSFNLAPMVEDLVLSGSDNLHGSGGADANRIVGNDGDNLLQAHAVDGHADWFLEGGGGYQMASYVTGSADSAFEERLEERASRFAAEQMITYVGMPELLEASPVAGDVLIGGAGNDTVLGGLDNDELYGGEGNDVMYGSAGTNLLVGGTGDDTYVVASHDRWDYGYWAVGEAAVWFMDEGSDTLVEEADSGIDTVVAAMSWTLGEHFENLTLVDDVRAWDDPTGVYPDAGPSRTYESTGAVGTGNAGDNVITANSLGNFLYGLEGHDTLIGGASYDLLDGGAGADVMAGGLGADTYVVDDVNDAVIEPDEGGDDSAGDAVRSWLTHYELGDRLEYLYFETPEDSTGTGNAWDNTIVGNLGNDSLFGQAGNDWIDGGEGNDFLVGGEGADVLAGNWGADLMVGGLGDDLYHVDDAGDVTDESSGDGFDLVQASVTHSLGDGLEDLLLTGYDAIDGTGNGQDNAITGNDADNILMGLAGDDTLEGGWGADVLIGGSGDDKYRINIQDTVEDAGLLRLADSIVEADGEGYETLLLTQTDGLSASDGVRIAMSGHVEALDASALRVDVVIVGNAENNVIQGGAGQDAIAGGEGDDHLMGGPPALVDLTSLPRAEYGNGPGAIVVERFTRFLARIDWGLPISPSADRLMDEGLMYGHRVPADYVPLYEPEGFDTYIPTYTEQPDGSWEFTPIVVNGSVRNLVGGVPLPEGELLRIALDGTVTAQGDSLQQLLDDWAPREIVPRTLAQLTELYGVQTAIDPSQANSYVRITGWDVASLMSGDPFDVLQSSMDELYWDDSAAPALYWPKEMLPFDTSDLLAIVEQTGADVLHGDAGDDLLDGGVGSDRLYGGEGNDTLLGGGDLTVEPLTLELNIEGYWNRLYLGNPEIPNNDYLDGGAGLDTMSGGTGDDTYIVDGVATENASGGVPTLNLCDEEHRFGMDRTPRWQWVSDAVIELDGEGHDIVNSTASVDLSAQSVEVVNLLDGGQDPEVTADLDATTGEGTQWLNGSAGRNRLDGGAGADVMAGGMGDDVYVVDVDTDQVIEHAGAGFDYVRTGLEGYVLGQEVEGLILEGKAITGHGNDADNVLIGNALDNTLSGGAGDDVLAGWRGGDLLLGGAGADTYAFSRGDGHDVVDDVQGSGRLHFSGDITRADLAFAREGDDLVITVAGGDAALGGTITLRGWVQAGERVDSITFCTAQSLVLDEALVNRAPVAVDDAAQTGEDGISGGNITASGNVLGNDADVDGDAMHVVTAGGLPQTIAGQYGSLSLSADGSYIYTLANGSALVQSLAAGQQVAEQFAYTVSDGVVGNPLTASASLTVTVTGANDAPVLAQPVADVSLAAGGAVSIALPSGLFTDVDQGDVLTLSAGALDAQGQLQGLPAWLTFDAATGRFAGTAPSATAAQALDVRVTATDLAGASATDVFRINVAAAAGGGGGCDGGDDDNGDDHDGHGDHDDHDDGCGDDGHHGDDCDDHDDDDHHGGGGNNSQSQNNWLMGDAAANLLDGGAGIDALFGGAGADTLRSGTGAGWLAGGKGNDLLFGGDAATVVAFNKGDGADTFYAGTSARNGARNTLSLGGGIRYADLSLARQGQDLLVKTGGSDSITLKDWYASSDNRSVEYLQVLTEGGDYAANSRDKLKNRKVEVFDFGDLVKAFDKAARKKASAANGWALMNELLDSHLERTNTAALGGDLSYQYATNAGGMASVGLLATQHFASGRASEMQSLHSRSQLEQGAGS